MLRWPAAVPRLVLLIITQNSRTNKPYYHFFMVTVVVRHLFVILVYFLFVCSHHLLFVCPPSDCRSTLSAWYQVIGQLRRGMVDRLTYRIFM